MTFAKQLIAVCVLALLLPIGAFARQKNERTIDIADPVQVGNTHLKPGDYKVEWQGNGPAVKVNFQQDGKTVATVPAKLKMHDSKVTQDDIVTKTTAANTKRLEEIDFLHQKEALLFGRSTRSTGSQSYR